MDELGKLTWTRVGGRLVTRSRVLTLMGRAGHVDAFGTEYSSLLVRITTHGAPNVVGTPKIKDTGSSSDLPCSLGLCLVGEDMIQLVRTGWQAKLSKHPENECLQPAQGVWGHRYHNLTVHQWLALVTMSRPHRVVSR